MRYFGFAIADSMFPTDCTVTRRALAVDEVRALIAQGVTPCLNPSHESTIAAMRQRFGIEVPIPSTPPKVELKTEDELIVMTVRGLPRLVDRHEYTESEVAAATFVFGLWTVA